MEFYTCSKHERPIRLSEKTRRFAYESLNHKYGLDTEKTPHIDLNGIKNYAELSPMKDIILRYTKLPPKRLYAFARGRADKRCRNVG